MEVHHTHHVYVHYIDDDATAKTLARIERSITDIGHLGAHIMTAISDFAAKQNAHNDKQDAAVTGLTADVAELNRQIAALQATQGAITPEDQALLDGIEARGQAISDKLEALDALTPPVPPVA